MRYEILVRCSIAMLAACLSAGCAAPSVQAISVDRGIGITTYRALGLIEPTPFGIGLYVDEETIASKITVMAPAQQKISYSIQYGDALTVRTMNALLLKFKPIELLSKPTIADQPRLNGLLTIEVSDIDVMPSQAPIRGRFGVYNVEANAWIDLQGLLRDASGVIVWAGDVRSEITGQGEYSVGDGAGQLAAQSNMAYERAVANALDAAIEEATATLVRQMAASSALQSFIRESENK